jgi:hypothetical protein
MAKTAKRSFSYQKRDPKTVQQRANARGGGFDSYVKSQFKIYKVKDGKNVIRILPATWEKAPHYGYDIYVNYGVGADRQSYLSLSKMKGEKDPLAEARRVAEREGDEEATKALRPNQRILVWLIDRLDEGEGPQLWAMPFTVDKDINNLCFDEDTRDVIYIDDPNEGNDLRFYTEGKEKNRKYPASKMKLLAAGPINEDADVQKEWLDYITENPVPDCLQFYDYDHISNVFNGGTSKPDEDDEDEDEEDTKPRTRPRTSLKPEPEEDDEEEVKPKKPAARKPAAKPKDDDEDEEGSESIRDRLKRTQASRRKPAEDDEEEEVEEEEDD